MQLSGVTDASDDITITMRGYQAAKEMTAADHSAALDCDYRGSTKQIRVFRCDVVNPRGALWVTLTFNDQVRPKKSWLIQGTVAMPGDDNPGNDSDAYYQPR